MKFLDLSDRFLLVFITGISLAVYIIIGYITLTDNQFRHDLSFIATFYMIVFNYVEFLYFREAIKIDKDIMLHKRKNDITDNNKL